MINFAIFNSNSPGHEALFSAYVIVISKIYDLYLHLYIQFCKSFSKIVPIPKNYRACLSKISEIVVFTVQTPNATVVSPFLSAMPIRTSFYKTHLCEQSSLPPPLTSLALPALSFRPIRLIRPAKKPLCSGCLLSRLNFLPVLLCPQAV